MANNLLVIHGGGPTAVINGSLYGAVQEAKEHANVDNILGAVGGTGGVLEGNFANLGVLPQKTLELLLSTPGSGIGSSRTPLLEADYENMAKVLKENDIKYVLMNGGNGTMDTCVKLSKVCAKYDILVAGIPKTIDNDISRLDHAPGFGSAARYIAGTTGEIACDVRGMPIHICIIEAMGRDAGWIAAASALAEVGGQQVADLIYMPERPFVEEEFLTDVEKLFKEKNYGIVVVSEGLTDKNKESIVPPKFQVGRAVYFGEVASHLSGRVIKELGIKTRNEIPGLAGRASIKWQSETDLAEAIEAGKLAARAVIGGQTGVMVSIGRENSSEYKATYEIITIDDSVLKERVMPDSYINSRGNGVTQEFKDWCRPLIGGALPEYFDINSLRRSL